MRSAAKLKKAAEFVPATEREAPSPVPSNLAIAFGCDLRALAIFRISLGFLTLADLWVRSGALIAHYTDFGTMPRGTYLDLFSNSWEFSLHHASGNVIGVFAIFAAHALVAMALIVGWRTRLMSILTWALVVSLQNRNPAILHSGDVVFRMILFWAMFLPLGARRSIDGALALNGIDEAKPNFLMNVATVGILVQIFCEYFFAALFKRGIEWHSAGTAIFYALSVEQFTTTIGLWFRDNFRGALPVLTRSVWFFEFLGPFLLFVPYRRGYVRLAFVAAFMFMHLNFEIMLGIGTFPFTCIVGLLPFLPTAFMDRVDRWFAEREGNARFVYAANVPAAERGTRILRTLLCFAKAPVQAASEANLTRALEYRGEWRGDWAFEDAAGETHVGVAGFQAAVAASPVWRPLGFVLRRWPFRSLLRWIYGISVRMFAPRAERWFPIADNEYQLGRWASAAVSAMIVYCIAWNIDGLGSVQPLIPSWLRPVALMLRVDQRWNMFSRPITEDGWYVYDGKLQNGAPIDVKTGIGGAPSFDRPKLISAQYPDERWQKYLMNLQQPTFEKHRMLYARYLCRLVNLNRPEGLKLESFDLIFVAEKVTPTERIGPTRRVLWRHNCFDAPPPRLLTK